MSFFFWLCAAAIGSVIILRMFLSAQKEKSPRHAHILKGVLVRGTAVFPIITINLSTEGAFVKLDERLENLDLPVTREKRRPGEVQAYPFLSAEEMERARENLSHYPDKTGETVILCLELKTEGGLFFQNGKLETQALVVWKSVPEKPHRYGLGLKFVRWTPQEKKRLKEYLSYVKHSAPVIPR